MEKIRVRYVVKPGNVNPISEFDHHYEVDSSKQENLSNILEKQLDHSLNELEKSLKKDRINLDG